MTAKNQDPVVHTYWKKKKKKFELGQNEPYYKKNKTKPHIADAVTYPNPSWTFSLTMFTVLKLLKKRVCVKKYCFILFFFTFSNVLNTITVFFYMLVEGFFYHCYFFFSCFLEIVLLQKKNKKTGFGAILFVFSVAFPWMLFVWWSYPRYGYKTRKARILKEDFPCCKGTKTA